MKGSREQSVLKYFREVPDLELAQAILSAAQGIVTKRVKEASVTVVARVTRKPKTNAAPKTTNGEGKPLSEEHVDAS